MIDQYTHSVCINIQILNENLIKLFNIHLKSCRIKLLRLRKDLWAVVNVSEKR